eukprot:gene7628-9384_t
MDEFQAKAFDIDGESAPDDSEPMTGEEYLKRVRWEANRLANVVVADNIDYSKINNTISKSYFTLPPKLPTCHPQLLPDQHWESNFLSDFSEFRQKLQCIKLNKKVNPTKQLVLPHLNDKRAWFIFCFGSSSSITTKDNNKEQQQQQQQKEQKEGIIPDINLIIQLDHILIVNLVEYHIEWLENKELNQQRSYWIYVLLSVLEKPIDSDTAANLRSLLRRLALLRSKIDSKDDPLLPSINILFTIVAKYFNQLEPGDL